ncbi:hypothetical protein K9M50_02930 [Patescibacteria group bacterium]|nr:hypothetical protein [Patescibacteria group bacterium]
MRGYNFFEILNPKNERTVIRILYFNYQDKMVLLHAYEKPNSYSTNKEKNKIKKENDIAQNYLNTFIKKPGQYEK